MSAQPPHTDCTPAATPAQAGVQAIHAAATGLDSRLRGNDGGGTADPIIAEVLAAIRFDANGLVPAIAQQHDTGEVLMMAWMNAASIAETLTSGQVCYWSRSRQAFWRKGETSGQVQALAELRVDCDGDTVLLLVDQTGVACHTGRRSCFYRALRDGTFQEIMAPQADPAALYHKHD